MLSTTQSNLERIKNYCAYQERSHSEVRKKLIELKVFGTELEETITFLIEENFLNEERFACAIARGKFNLKNWGKIKIKQTLLQHEVSSYCIKKALLEIDEDQYQKTISRLAEKKWSELKSEKNKFTKMSKLKNYLAQKGFEYVYIHECLQKILNHER